MGYDASARKEIERCKKEIIRLDELIMRISNLLMDTLPPAYADDLRKLFISGEKE